MDSSVALFDRLRGKILLHAGSNDTAALPVVSRVADGVIFHGRNVDEASQLPADQRPAVVLHDPDRYSGQRRGYEVQSLFGPYAEDLAVQSRLDVDALLTPSVLPAKGDTDGLSAVFQRGSEYLAEARSEEPDRPGFIVVCASPYWLVGEGAASLEEQVSHAKEPIALVLADWGDPLRTPEAVDACLKLIRLAPALMSIRCDLSAIGLVANGALAGAVGASTSVRHLYLPRRGGRSTKRNRLVFVPALRAWHGVDEIGLIVGADEIFACWCAVCAGQDVRRFSQYADELELLLHQLASVRHIAARVLAGEDASLWPARWERECTSAQHAYALLAEAAGVQLGEPAYLKAWLAQPTAV